MDFQVAQFSPLLVTLERLELSVDLAIAVQSPPIPPPMTKIDKGIRGEFPTSFILYSIRAASRCYLTIMKISETVDQADTI